MFKFRDLSPDWYFQMSVLCKTPFMDLWIDAHMEDRKKHDRKKGKKREVKEEEGKKKKRRGKRTKKTKKGEN